MTILRLISSKQFFCQFYLLCIEKGRQMERLKQILSHLTMSNTNSTTSKIHNANPPLPSSGDSYVYFGQDVVNRVSFLRENAQFITTAIRFAKFVVFDGDAILCHVEEKEDVRIYEASYDDLKDVIDPWAQWNEDEDLKVNQLRVTFLGLDERDLSSGFKHSHYQGLPYFALDLSTHPSELSKLLSQNSNLQPIKDRKQVFQLNNRDVSLYSHAKMYLDWMKRNLFCGGCGSQNIVIHAGTKLLCSSSSLTNDSTSKCPVKSASVSNLSFPRTDTVIITATTTAAYDKVLLGRGKRFPGPLYSCIAGFMEPSETIEIASLREIWEETGVRPQKVEIFKSQPWPYPANLMIGCLAFVEWNGENEIVDLGHDPELVDAKWVDVKELKKKMANTSDNDQDGWYLPPKEAIAYSLITEVIERFDKSQK